MSTLTTVLAMMGVLTLLAQNENSGYDMTMSIDMSSHEADISPTLYGVFFEEINHAGEGGLYGELLGNRSFEDKQMPEGYHVEGDRIIPPVHTNYGTGKPSECSFPWPKAEVPDWQLNLEGEAIATMHTTTSEPHFTSAPTTLKVMVEKKGKSVSLTNAGFWGMGIRLEAQADYRLRMIVKGTSKKPLLISLEDADGKRIGSAKLKLKGNGKWQDEVLAIKADEACSDARLVIAFPEAGNYDFDYISLFPVDTYKQRENGMRRDVALMIDSLHPKFVRWPGGCVVEGITLNNRFEWKKTLGDPASRPGEYDSWGYRNSYGFGYKEFLDFCEDLGAKAMYVCNVGMACTGRTGEVCKEEEVETYIQDALDAIEYAIGDSTTVWGAVRCKAGHPQPYPLEYVEIGNENFGPIYERRYNQFYQAIKARYPQLTLVSDYGFEGNQTAEHFDMVDPHWYVEPERFFHDAYLFDTFDRKKNKYKVYVGEYACNDGVGTGNMLAALSEAAFLTGVERNSDVVRMASYAPLFEHKGDRAWPVNLIWISNEQVVGRSSYYVQKMFAGNVPDYNLKTDISIRPETEHEALTDYDGYISIEPRPADWQMSEDVKYGPGTIVEFKARGNEAYTFYWGKTKQNLEKALALNIGKKSGALSIDRVYWNNAYPYVSQPIDVPSDSTMRHYRLEILRDGIICSIDGREIWHYQTPLVNRRFAVAGFDKTRQEVIIKAVNASDEPCKMHINLTNGKVESTGQTIILKADSNQDENSYDDPFRIYPKETELKGISPSFNYQMAPNSVNILRLKVIEHI